MKRNPQGKHWYRLDNTGKLFPMIANENLSNVFRISVVLKEEIVPERLQQALEDTLPRFEGFKVKLKRGFFWYYFEGNRRTPFVEKESGWPCRYIDPKSNQLYLFRVSYYRHRINLEVFHAVTDGVGAVNFIRELTARYLDLKMGRPTPFGDREESLEPKLEDSYLKHYRKLPKKRYNTKPAYSLEGRYLPLGGEGVIHGRVHLQDLKRVCRQRQVSVTKYLAAVLIWSIYEEYLNGQPGSRHIGVNLPINLRAFFGSTTTSNFFAVTSIDYKPDQIHQSFESILDQVKRQMDDNITREKLEERISYNVSNEKKWYVRILPLCLKWMVLGFIFKRNDRAHTITLSNIGTISMGEAYENMVESASLLIGVSRQQPAKCGVCSFGEQVNITFTSVFEDSRLEDRFFGRLEKDGIPVELESNGVVKQSEDKGNYPEVEYDQRKWKHLVVLFYGILAVVALLLGVVNAATFSGFWWSGMVVAGIAYAGLTVRYSVLYHGNLGKSVMVQTLGMDLLLVAADRVMGYQGWSVNYAIPATILFADVAVVFLILVNRLNWQSYFMYQIAITMFSFIPLMLWAAGFVTRPLVAFITMILTVLLLFLTILLGDRRFKNELIRRFHL